jgi:hypothetical protein
MNPVIFSRGETAAFLAWTAANPNGFVTNWLLKGKLLVLHLACCRTLRVENIKGQKVCSVDRAELDQWCLEQFKRKPGPCGVCHPE